MFERFTDRARRVLVLAQEEARLLNHGFIGTEHILLGLIHEGDGVAAQALEELDITLEAVREKVEETIGLSGTAPTGSPPFTPRAKKVLELSLREALHLGHNYIGTEHLLLGLVREGEGVAAQVLVALGAGLIEVRQRVLQKLSGSPGPEVVGLAPTSPLPAQFSRRWAASASLPEPGVGCSFCGRDPWEITRYVTTGRLRICEECVALASRTLARGEADPDGAFMFPPRVFGEVPDDGAVDAVVAAFRQTFGSDDPDDPDDPAHEDADHLAPYVEAWATELPKDQRRCRVNRIRFRDEHTAKVEFAFGSVDGPEWTQRGEGVRVGSRWVVTRITMVSALRSAGIAVPPTGPPE